MAHGSELGARGRIGVMWIGAGGFGETAAGARHRPDTEGAGP